MLTAKSIQNRKDMRPAGFQFVIGMCLFIGAAGQLVLADEHTVAGVRTQADAAYLSVIAQASLASDRSTMNSALDRLVGLNNGDLYRLIPQLVLYAATNDKSPNSKAIVGHAFERLDRSKNGVVAALAPLLDDADASVQELTRSLLRGYEDRSAARPPDFTAYHAILEIDFRAGREPQQSLVAFMFDSDPGAALLTLMRAAQLRKPDEIKPILWAEHVVSDLLWRRQFGFLNRDAIDSAAVHELDRLSQHTAWWARLYVAEIIRKYPELGTKSIQDRLVADANELVRRSSTAPIKSK